MYSSRNDILGCWLGVVLCLLLVLLVGSLRADETQKRTNSVSSAFSAKPLAAALPPGKWREVEAAVDRGLAYLAAHQEADGSFSSIRSGQPGVTSLSVMAFLSRGHQPGVRPYGDQLGRAIDFVVASQRPDGLLCSEPPGAYWERYEASHTAVYNHAVAGLMLGEVYGQISGSRAKVVKQAIEKALVFTRQLQLRRKDAVDVGGWRYLRTKPSEPDSDLSITAWQLMFMRSAKNAEFEIPQKYVDEAMDYVRRSWDPQARMFHYALVGDSGFGASRGMVGAGILSLSMAGQHQTPMAQAAGDWLLAHPFRNFGELIGSYDKFFYSTYYCSQAMAQLGGRHWERFFPPMVDVLLKTQAYDGSWPPEPASGVAIFGAPLSTALAVLSLTPPYQLLPVYQR